MPCYSLNQSEKIWKEEIIMTVGGTICFQKREQNLHVRRSRVSVIYQVLLTKANSIKFLLMRTERLLNYQFTLERQSPKQCCSVLFLHLTMIQVKALIFHVSQGLPMYQQCVCFKRIKNSYHYARKDFA